jgi:hypothetical protein
MDSRRGAEDAEGRDKRFGRIPARHPHSARSKIPPSPPVRIDPFDKLRIRNAYRSRLPYGYLDCAHRKCDHQIKWALALLPAPTASEFGSPCHEGHSFLSLTSGSPISPEGFVGSPWYFGYPIRRCATCVMPHSIFVFFVPTISISSPVLRRVAYQFGDPAVCLFRSTFPFPVRLCVLAFLPDDLKVSCFSSRTKGNLPTYPQTTHFAVDKMEDKSTAEKDTAPTQCMEAVKIVRGRGREEERAARSMCVSTIACR